MAGIAADAFETGVETARAFGFEIFDRIIETDWCPADPADLAYRRLLSGVEPGLTFLALHFTKPGEIEVIDPGFHRIRVAEYDLFRSTGFVEWLHRQDMTRIGMRELRDAFRARKGDGGPEWIASASG
jgi:hypothetical protein